MTREAGALSSPEALAPGRSALCDWLTLFRASNLPTVWTNVAAALLLADAPRDAALWGVLFLSLSALYAGGACLNDVFDREVDRRWKPDRPLASGRIPEFQALVVVSALLAAGPLLLLATSQPAGAFAGPVLVAAIVAYDALHGRFGWSVYLMASCRFLVFPVAALASTGRLSLPPLLGGAAQFLWVLLVSRVARREKERGTEYRLPVVPLLLAGISLVDGILMACRAGAPAFAWGVAGATLTLVGQRWIRGD